MEGVFKIYNLPVGKSVTKGEASVSAYEFKVKNDPLYNLRAIRDSGGLMTMEEGKYVRLVVGEELVMSDTRMEKTTNAEFVNKAHGRVLIAGLGLGLVLHNLRRKIKEGIVKEIIVVEKSRDVINLILPYFSDINKSKIVLKAVHADIFEWKPEKGQKFDVIYLDITTDINEENLNEIKKLHNKFKFFLNRDNPNCWMDSWMKWWLQRERSKERRRNSYW